MIKCENCINRSTISAEQVIPMAATFSIIVSQSMISSLDSECSAIKCHIYFLKNAVEDLSAAIDALRNNNVTGAVNEARSESILS
jgi:hypothetical protein